MKVSAKDKIFWAYIAGFADGEGCIKVYRYDNSKYVEGGSKGFRATVTISQQTKYEQVLLDISKFLKAQGIKHSVFCCQHVQNHCPMSILQITHKKHVKLFIEGIQSYSIRKKEDLQIVYDFCKG